MKLTELKKCKQEQNNYLKSNQRQAKTERKEGVEKTQRKHHLQEGRGLGEGLS
jgi:hypothetical protein